MTYPLMRCPALADLPPPPPGRHGWPWDVESDRLPETTTDGKPWPVISIVTPSYNQGCYIEETIRSILLQGYPHLEFHVMDGGSADETVEILRKYEPWLSSWLSEKDSGQSEAINKGFARCSGELFNWLCSDDMLTKGALNAVATLFQENPGTDVVAGACALQYDEEPKKSCVRLIDWKDWAHAPYSGVIWQPSCFFRRELVSRRDLVRTDLHYCMDRELWTYFWSLNSKWEWAENVFSVYRFTEVNKSSVGGIKVIRELEIIYRTYFKEFVPLPSLLRKWWLPLVRLQISNRAGLIRSLSRVASRGVTIILLVLYPRASVRALQRDFYHYGRCFTADS